MIDIIPAKAHHAEPHRRHDLVEPKLDGVRAIIHCSRAGVSITTRNVDANGHYRHIEDRVPHLVEDFERYGLNGLTIFDGEITPADGQDLGITAGILNSTPANARAAQRSADSMLHVHLFDILYQDDVDLRNLEQIGRTRVLSRIRLSHYMHTVPQGQIKPAEVDDWMTLYTSQGYEGIVLKDSKAKYGSSRAWLKMKKTVTLDVKIMDYVDGKGKYTGTVGSLVVGALDKHGQLREVAKVAPGDDANRAMFNLNRERYRGVIIEIAGQEITRHGKIRHPRFLRLRPDRARPNILTVEGDTISIT